MGPVIIIKSLTDHNEMVAVEALHRKTISRPEPFAPQILLDIVQSGGQVLGGFEEGEMVGFAVSRLADEGASPHLFSLIMLVQREHRDSGLGRRFKVAQRQHALSLGLERMEWTFSPLVARTAHFHLTVLGTLSRAYEARFHDSSEGHVGPFVANDRLLATWELNSPRVEARLAGERPAAPDDGAWATRVVVEGGLARLAESMAGRSDPKILIEIPFDLEPYRAHPEVLAPWRREVGRLLDHYINGEGYVAIECLAPVVDGIRKPFYVLERPAP